MAITLAKDQKISLKKDDGHTLTHFCVGCNWGAIQKEKKSFFGLMSSKETQDVDLDLSCLLIDESGNIVDHIYSPLYRESFLSAYGLPKGKLDSNDGALHHSGDDLKGDTSSNDGLDNEIITVSLEKVAKNVHQIIFFLNNCGKEDFFQIPYASIRMYEGTPTKVDAVFAQYDVTAKPEFQNSRALIMGKLYKKGDEWKFAAIGDAYPDENIAVTVRRIARDYAKS